MIPERIDFDDETLRLLRYQPSEAFARLKLDDAFWTELTRRCRRITDRERALGFYKSSVLL